MQLQSHKSLNGYTLIEILVGLTIIGLLFALSFASFRDFSRRQQLSGTAKKVQGDLRMTQGNAITGQKPDGVSCNAPNRLDSYSFNILTENEYAVEANCVGSLTSAIEVKSVTLPPGITISTPTPNPLKFKILGQGTNVPTGSTWTITLSQTGTLNTTSVTVTAGGEIR